MQYNEHFDVVVVGAGHAGCEAAMAAARMGLKTALYTLNVDLIAQMSCNPAVGGIAKGHLVREVDALGGIMGEVTDAVGIQFRLLNTSRGPAVWSPRAQCDKQAYRLKMREVLESQPNLKIKQAEVTDVILEPSAIPRQPSATENREPRTSHVGTSHVGTGDSPVQAERSSAGISDRSIRGVLLRDGRRVSAGAVIITQMTIGKQTPLAPTSTNFVAEPREGPAYQLHQLPGAETTTETQPLDNATRRTDDNQTLKPSQVPPKGVPLLPKDDAP